MVKVMTIRDEVYARLNKIRFQRGGSFGDAISYLLETEAKHGKGASITGLAGSIHRMNINQRNARKVAGDV
jgi:predicted CopG family antitoxin